MATILVVDDEFGVGEVLDTILTDAGHRVLTAINGKQGLARLVETTPDVVLLDFMMPLLDGPGMLRAMAADPAHRGIPVIMMSSLDEDTVAEKCDRHVAFLRKPCGARPRRQGRATSVNEARAGPPSRDLAQGIDANLRQSGNTWDGFRGMAERSVAAPSTDLETMAKGECGRIPTRPEVVFEHPPPAQAFDLRRHTEEGISHGRDDGQDQRVGEGHDRRCDR